MESGDLHNKAAQHALGDHLMDPADVGGLAKLGAGVVKQWQHERSRQPEHGLG